MSYAQLVRLIRAEATATIQHAGIGSAGVRVHSGGFITIENGGLDVEGTATIVGLLTGSGTIDWWGPSIFRGTLNVTGNMATSGTLVVLGATTLNGDVALNNDLTLGTGRILAGPVRIDRAGSYGGRVYSSSILVLEAGNAVLINNDTDIRGILLTDGLDVDGPKNFRIAHPTKPGFWLRHGSTESPVSGTEYKGRLKLDAAGEGIVELPPYFEALNKPDGRTVQLTAIGRPFPVGADDVADGQVKVYGDPNREVFWHVMAERIGADFLLEEEIPAEATDDGRVGPWAAA
ncbi:hypothetical protein [Microbacterium sp. K24]|uniref:hypothetical protein n=1 Tax=Microbacterium sp. K24 TaxID=2305446 RepID=UPI00109CD861|nr:hypothetical protein [Microbacterium sp. K24]